MAKKHDKATTALALTMIGVPKALEGVIRATEPSGSDTASIQNLYTLLENGDDAEKKLRDDIEAALTEINNEAKQALDYAKAGDMKVLGFLEKKNGGVFLNPIKTLLGTKKGGGGSAKTQAIADVLADF